jgi:2-hydroxy-3-keto-5-methylthiopentenyl-1-phosphate phosphatase
MAQIFCDFDGTITSHDSIIFLTEQFGGGPEVRHAARRAIVEGRLSVYEAVHQELSTVNITWDKAAQELKSSISVDPTFPDFVQWCSTNEHSLVVVSAGMEPVIDLFIGHFNLPVFAQSLRVTPKGWDYQKNESSDKEKVLSSAKKDGGLVHIGDGTSDVVAIPYVDLLLAKTGSYLENYCKTHNASYTAFENFDDVREAIVDTGLAN